jgi:GH25 family lysozyme M1 (1,4-beta-N-acetylmuramidase)
VKADFDFAILRATVGVDINPATPQIDGDPYFTPKRWTAVQEAGLVRGAYMFWHVTEDAAKQVQSFIEWTDKAGGLKAGDLPPVLDVEFSAGRAATGMSAAQALDRVRSAAQALKAHYGCCMLYTSQHTWRDDLDDLPAADLAADCTLWLCGYYQDPQHRPPVPRSWGDMDDFWIHQHRGNVAGVPGFTGKVDLNRFNPLRRGAVGARVKWLQKRLPGLVADGLFGKKTEAAVCAYQQTASLRPTGVVDVKTFTHLVWVTVA